MPKTTKSFKTPYGGHYTKDGKEWKGSQHVMPNGDLNTGKTHTESSEKLYHYKELSPAIRKKIGKEMMNGKKKSGGVTVVFSVGTPKKSKKMNMGGVAKKPMGR